MRRTKIVCTIGPASSSSTMLTALMSGGMDVARLNFSHGTHDAHGQVIQRLRTISLGRELPLAILQDLSGPKVRLGMLSGNGIRCLEKAEVVRLSLNPTDNELPLPVPELLAVLKRGDRLLADDGNVELLVVRTGDGWADVKAARICSLSSHKGVTAPGVRLDIPAVTEKDLIDLQFGLSQGVDFVALSFVRSAEDVRILRRAMENFGSVVPIIAKLEKWEAIRHLDEIIAEADAIMVARGDLGVEIPMDEIPMAQKRIIRRCNQVGKPVITATQMLESMIHNPRPTRAEVTDVANAVLDGTDAVMLSGETASGDYPVEAVKTMAQVAAQADSARGEQDELLHRRADRKTAADSVAQAVVEMARDLHARAIVCATSGGGTARLIARYRPEAPVIAVTPNESTFRRLALLWGVRPILIKEIRSTDEMMQESLRVVVNKVKLRIGEHLILTAGVPVNQPGSTNLIRVHTVGEAFASISD